MASSDMSASYDNRISRFRKIVSKTETASDTNRQPGEQP
jgi:hypothetical protein